MRRVWARGNGVGCRKGRGQRGQQGRLGRQQDSRGVRGVRQEGQHRRAQVVAGRATPNQGVNKCCRPSEIYFVSSTIFPVIPREIKSGRVIPF
jgi:hypothetical protein